MKKGAAALIIIFFLALGFAAWGAYSLNDDALSLTITSEPLLGESALGDFPVTERSQLALRVLFTADSAGANSVESRTAPTTASHSPPRAPARARRSCWTRAGKPNSTPGTA